MTIGYIGLGKMGKGMVLNLRDHRWNVIAYNRSAAPRKAVARAGVETAETISELVSRLRGPRVIWLMVSHTAIDSVLKELVPLLKRGDVVIDGGNSPYEKSIQRAKQLKRKGIWFMDVGVSGGPAGARNGACMMIGGDKRMFKKYEKLFRDGCVPKGYAYMGEHGAGHFVKMVHNGIEYGMMQSIAEGFTVMKKSKFNLSMREVARVYRYGSVVSSRLIDWLETAYKMYGDELNGISGKVAHSGEGLWTVTAAKKLRVPVDIIKRSLQFRVQSQKRPSYTGQVLTALRNQFGGHSKKGDK